MNQDVNSFVPMASVADDDFANFLDLNNLEDIDLDFPTYDANDGSMESSRELNDLADSLDLQHLPASGTLTPQVEFGLGGQAQQTGHPGNNLQEMDNSIFDFGFQAPVGQYQEHNQYGMQYGLNFHPQSVVPPTPNSVEMHADTARYLQHMDAQTRAILEQRYQLRKDDAEGAFTPLGTPAVTPHDTHFQIPRDFTVPGAYAFSPLTSPALEAQNQNMRAYYSSAGGSTSSLGTASLLDQDVDMLGDSAAPLIELAPRSRTNNRASVRSGPSTRIRQSPIVKPTRRKATLSSTVPPKEVSDLLEEVQRRRTASSQQQTSGLSVPNSMESSPAESISPEPLSEPLMGPPPKPSSVHPSPSILANGTRGATSLSAPKPQAPCPATPASLMRLPAQPDHPSSVPPSPSFLTTPADTISMPMLEDLALPEAADPAPPRPSLTRIDTTIPAPGGSDDTPRIPARKTPKLSANCTPMMSATSSSSAKPSPVIAAMSPSSARRVEPKAGRGKKRGSVSGAGPGAGVGGGFGGGQGQSPALRPKISPVIKPLLPDGGHPTHPTHQTLSPDAHALLLASRSNYQNLIEGTAVPGVSYPETLATNLTAKRTSHKLAEQGRRNRINVALAEMAVLLPGSAASVSSPAAGQGNGEKEGAASCKSPDGGGAGREGKEGASKAATVEKAIEYIRILQREAGAREGVIREREGEIAALRERLSKLESGSNGTERDESEEAAATAGASEVMSDGQ